MSWTWSFWTTGSSFVARVNCWPIVPGTLRISSDDGVTSLLLIDDGIGNLTGDGSGTVDYSSGVVSCDFSLPLPVSGTPILASYEGVEGGCSDGGCGKCATNKIKLDLVPGAITGQGEIAISDAWVRLLEKIERDVKPIHVEIITESFVETYFWSVGHRFDVIPADEESLDAGGLRLVWDSTEW